MQTASPLRERLAILNSDSVIFVINLKSDTAYPEENTSDFVKAYLENSCQKRKQSTCYLNTLLHIFKTAETISMMTMKTKEGLDETFLNFTIQGLIVLF